MLNHGRVLSLVRELISHKLRDVASHKKEKKFLLLILLTFFFSV